MGCDLTENKIFSQGNVLVMKKNHACGKNAKEFIVLKTGSDIKIKCTNCGHEVIVPRIKLEKNVKSIK